MEKSCEKGSYAIILLKIKNEILKIGIQGKEFDKKWK